MYVFPATHYVAGPERMERAIRGIELELEDQLAALREAGQAARGPAAAHAHDLRPRDDAPGRLLQRHRELLAAHRRPRVRATAPQLPLDYFPEDFLLVIDESHVDGAADRRDVRGRHVAQAHARRARLPAAERDGQPAAALGGVPRADRPDGLPLGDARASTSWRKSRAARRADHPPDRPDRPRGRRSSRPRARSTTSSHEIRSRTERNERVLVTTLTKKMAEDLTDYLLDKGIRVRYLHSDIDTLRRVELLRELRTRRVRRPRRHQPAARGPRPARGVARRDPRRRQGGVPALGPRRSSRRSAGRPATCPARCTCTPTRSPPRWRRRSTRPTAAARSRSPTTPSTASTRPPLRKKIADITDLLAREDADTEELLGSGRMQSRGKTPVRVAARWRPTSASSAGGSTNRPADMAAADLAGLIQELTDPDAPGRRQSSTSSSRPGCATRSATSRRSCGR